MKENLEKKLRKAFRKGQRENFGLGFEGNKYELAFKLPLGYYKKMAGELTDDELCELKDIFKCYGQEELLLDLIPSNVWFDRYCLSPKLMDSFSDEQLERVLNRSKGDISGLFFTSGQNLMRQFRIMYLLSEERLEEWIYFLRDFSKFESFIPSFFSYLTNKTGEEADIIFKKLASLSNGTVAKLMENVQDAPARRILQELMQLDRDLFSIIKKIKKEKLYEVLMDKLDLFRNADVKKSKEMYSWLYSNFPTEDRTNFLTYLADEKQDDLKLFDEEICAGIYHVLYEEETQEFVWRIYDQKTDEEFKAFYETFSIAEKEMILDKLMKVDVGREMIKVLLSHEEQLSLLERLVKEKCVTC